MSVCQARTSYFSVLLLVALFGSAFGQSLPGQGQGAMWTTPDNIGSTPAVIYADAFPASVGDACQRINAAWSTLPTTGGAVDARGFTGTQTCSINPFNGVTQSGILFLGNATYAVATPWTIPPEVRVYGNGRGSDTSTPNPGTSLQAVFSPFTTTGSVSIPANSAAVTATVPTFSSSMVGALFFATDGTTVVQSTVAVFTDTTHITLSMTTTTALTSTLMFSVTPAMVQFNATSSGSTTFGISISNLQIDCNALVHGIGIQNWWAQELSYAKDVNVSNCVGIALDVETTNAQNSGPYANIAVGQNGGVGVGAPVAQTLCAELFSTGDLRGVHGLTCTSNGTPAVGVDLNTPSATLEDAHLEGYGIGVEVGSHSSNTNRANGLNIINVSGGSGTGAINTLVDIFSDPTVGGSTDINVFGLSAPVSTTITNLLNDHIMGTIVPFSSEKSLSFYVLGRVLNAGGGRVRLTSSPNSSNAPNVIPAIAQAYTKGSTFTSQNLGCFSAPSTVSDCSTNNQFVGINLPSTGTLALVQTAGDTVVNLDGTKATVTAGEFICVSSTAAKAVDVGTTLTSLNCPYGSGIGIAAASASGSPTSILVHLRSF